MKKSKPTKLTILHNIHYDLYKNKITYGFSSMRRTRRYVQKYIAKKFDLWHRQTNWNYDYGWISKRVIGFGVHCKKKR